MIICVHVGYVAKDSVCDIPALTFCLMVARNVDL